MLFPRFTKYPKKFRKKLPKNFSEAVKNIQDNKKLKKQLLENIPEKTESHEYDDSFDSEVFQKYIKTIHIGRNYL